VSFMEMGPDGAVRDVRACAGVRRAAPAHVTDCPVCPGTLC
jgi:hypothetical protein